MPSTVVRKFYLLQATRSVGFVSPIFTLSLLRDLSFTVVSSLSALPAAVVVLGEGPAGYVGDRLGRRTSIGLSIGLKAVSLLGARRLLIAVPAVTSGLLVLPRLTLIAALPMFVAQRASWALLLPVVNGRVSEAVDDAGRATAVSAVSMLTRLDKLPLAVGAGVLADVLGETTAVAALGGVFLLVAAASTVVRPLRLLTDDASVDRDTTT
jgi:MFS family permease